MRVVALLVTVFLGPMAGAQVKWISHDVEIIQVPYFRSQAQITSVTDCRAKIAQAVCLADPATGGSPLDRACLPGSSNYAPTFEALYDRLPGHLQKMFCRLERIFIEKHFEATAYAGLMKDPNGVVIGSVMGVRKDFVDQILPLDQWASWKEQLNFGGDPTQYTTNAALPMVHISTPDMLYYVVTHEFGHMFDFANNLNHYDCAGEGCKSTPGSWSALSWQNNRGETNPGNDFSWRKSLCFYWCGGNFIPPTKAAEVYSGLFSTNFISVYAASNAMDDWAETLAYYTFDRELRASYQITLADGQTFDAMAQLHSPRMAAKVDFLERLFRNGIKYPGDL